MSVVTAIDAPALPNRGRRHEPRLPVSGKPGLVVLPGPTTDMSAPATTRDELREEVERLRLLQSISLEFSASLDFDHLLPTVFNRVVAALGAEGGSI